MVFRDEEGRFYHIGVKEGELSHLVLLPGSRKRVKRIGELLEGAEVLHDGRFLVIKGKYKGRVVTALDTGIGPSSAAIVVREVIEAIKYPESGVATLIRPGTCGSLQPYVKVGDLVVTRGCIAQEGVSKRIVGEGFPLLADPEVVMALVRAAEKNGYELGRNLHVGIHHVKDALYEVEDASLAARPEEAAENLRYLRRMGVLCTEMEFSILSALAARYNAEWRASGVKRRVRVGGVFLVVSPVKEEMEEVEFTKVSQEGLIRTALDALVMLEGE